MNRESDPFIENSACQGSRGLCYLQARGVAFDRGQALDPLPRGDAAAPERPSGRRLHGRQVDAAPAQEGAETQQVVRVAPHSHRRERFRLRVIVGGWQPDPDSLLAATGHVRLRVVEEQLRIRRNRPHPFSPGDRAA